MSGACAPRFARLVDRAFVRGLPARQRRRLREHLATCAACRERWDRLAIIDRGLGGPHLTAAMMDDIGDAVIARRDRRAWWAAAALGTVATAALVFVVVRPGDPDSTLTPRGKPGDGRTPGVRLFCVAGDADHVRAEVRMVSSGPLPKLRCSIDDDLQIAYTTPDREGLSMVAFSRLASTVIHYAPDTDAGSALPLHGDRIDELVGWSTHLGTEHRAGGYDVIVRVFDHDVTTRDAVDGRVPPVAELRARLEITAGGGRDDAR